MVVKLSKAEKKVRYNKKLWSLLDEYEKVLIAAADNVGSNQLQSIRRGLRGDSIILMGKNTLIRRCIRFHTEKTGNKDFLNLLPLLVGNVELIFTKGDLKEVSEEVAKYKGSASDSIVKFQFPSWAYLSTIFFGIIFIFYADNIAEERVKYSKDILSYLEDLWLNDECQYNGSMLDVFLAASCFFFSKASNDFWKIGQGLDDPWSNSWLAENAHFFFFRTKLGLQRAADPSSIATARHPSREIPITGRRLSVPDRDPAGLPCALAP
ncbi:hypothetical protein ZIOFF_043509 [Zingiber officinale]|uniref:60S acidic ribosomal protein P0 n=1 Tax=Zingiber officinale TaxID=94328 RepID=A0A8J5KQ48_ZINOF|nr:hypothetical protein ZIOFF_043509 [Zingiber officinale]